MGGTNKSTPPEKRTAGGTDAANKEAQKKKKKRPLKQAAVVITCPEGKYSECIRLARERVNLEELGIEATKSKRALTGALILEIPGPESESKANRLAACLPAGSAGGQGGH